jgi:hypothetical protein
MKTWKPALSLAVVAAIAVPAVAGTWRRSPARWIEFNQSELHRISKLMEETKDCTHLDESNDDLSYVMCEIYRKRLSDGGIWYPAEEVTLGYLARNFYVSAGAFALVFAVTMIGLENWGALKANR